MKSDNTIFNNEVIGFTKKDDVYLTYGKSPVEVKAGSRVAIGSHTDFKLSIDQLANTAISAFEKHDIVHYGLTIPHENVQLTVAKLVKSGSMLTSAEDSSYYIESPVFGSVFDKESERNRIASYRLAKSGIFVPYCSGEELYSLKGTKSTVEILESLAEIGFKPADMSLFAWRLKFQSERVFKIIAI